MVVAPAATTVERVEQGVVFVPSDRKRDLLATLLRDPAFARVLVFTRTKHGADRVVRHLVGAGIEATAIHGNKSQPQRERALAGFRDGQARVLVATDIAARGIDVDGVSHVINFELPNVPEDYVHRIGRTARAGAAGIAIAFCSDEERPYLRDIEKLTRCSLRAIPVPPAMSVAARALPIERPAEPAAGGPPRVAAGCRDRPRPARRDIRRRAAGADRRRGETSGPPAAERPPPAACPSNPRPAPRPPRHAVCSCALNARARNPSMLIAREGEEIVCPKGTVCGRITRDANDQITDGDFAVREFLSSPDGRRYLCVCCGRPVAMREHALAGGFISAAGGSGNAGRWTRSSPEPRLSGADIGAQPRQLSTSFGGFFATCAAMYLFVAVSLWIRCHCRCSPPGFSSAFSSFSMIADTARFSGRDGQTS